MAKGYFKYLFVELCRKWCITKLRHPNLIIVLLVLVLVLLILVCGRTIRNNTPSEALVFHQTLSTSTTSYIGRLPSSTPQGRTQIIHVFPLGSNNENEFTILSPFHTTRVLRKYIIIVPSSECGITINVYR